MIHVYLICNIAKNIKERYTMSTESPENLVQKSPQRSGCSLGGIGWRKSLDSGSFIFRLDSLPCFQAHGLLGLRSRFPQGHTLLRHVFLLLFDSRSWATSSSTFSATFAPHLPPFSPKCACIVMLFALGLRS